jgi:hypothetical protein
VQLRATVQRPQKSFCVNFHAARSIEAAQKYCAIASMIRNSGAFVLYLLMRVSCHFYQLNGIVLA